MLSIEKLWNSCRCIQVFQKSNFAGKPQFYHLATRLSCFPRSDRFSLFLRKCSPIWKLEWVQFVYELFYQIKWCSMKKSSSSTHNSVNSQLNWLFTYSRSAFSTSSHRILKGCVLKGQYLIELIFFVSLSTILCETGIFLPVTGWWITTQL